MIGKFIDFKVFIISLSIGLFMVYLYQPNFTIIYVYPTPDNVKNFRIKDKADNCFNYNVTEVNCPSNSELISNIPIQN